MSISAFRELADKKLISEASFDRIKTAGKAQKVSLHLELRALLYLGVLLTSSAIGVLIYKNIDQLGHLVIVSGLALGCLGCYGFCFWKRRTPAAVTGTGNPVMFDYILLLGCLLLLITVGYLQSQFGIFGQKWGLASFIPMVLLFASAYYFDHRGALGLAIINLAAWVGITINRSTFYGINELNKSETIIAAILLSICLILLAIVVKEKGIKPHFSSTYHQFGTHGAYLAAIAGIIHFNHNYLAWFGILLAVAIFHAWKAWRESSAYYMVITCLYLYTGISFIMTDKIFSGLRGSDSKLYANFFYYLITGIAMAIVLIRLNKKLKAHAGL